MVTRLRGAGAPVIGKVSRRLIPFLFVLYIFNHLDRINIGFAALLMNRDLRLSATAFGFASTIFYVGYVACEVPSNLLMVRYGARVLLARIMVTWGLASAATMLVFDATSLYAARFLVGVLEAGFVPGVLLYLSGWFPESHRGRANSLLMMAQPVAMAAGAGISGLIMRGAHGALGLQGWRWMFLLEGVPAFLLGIVIFFYLPDRPEHASWLTHGEASELNRLLVNGKPAPHVRVGMPLWGMSSDRKQERTWHVVAALALAALGWQLVIFGHKAELRLLGLVFTTSGAFCAMSVFWTLPQTLLSEEARPAGIAAISAVGLLGSASSPTVIGLLRDATGNFAAGLFYSTALLIISMLLVVLVSRGRGVVSLSVGGVEPV